MPGSYQRSNGQPVAPRRIEELGKTPEELAQAKTQRRLLFTGLGAIFLLALGVFGYEVQGHQQQAAQQYQEQVEEPNLIISSASMLNEKTHANVATGCETTIMIIRHCEKSGDEIHDNQGNEHCAYVGYERANFLPTLFGDNSAPSLSSPSSSSLWPVPAQLYALSPSREGGQHFNYREVETLVPLAKQHGLEIHDKFENSAALARHLIQQVLSTGEYCGKLILICWKHEYIGNLARMLACNDCPAEYDEFEFDKVWQLKYVYDVPGTAVIQNNQNGSNVNVNVNANANTNLAGENGGRHLRKKRPSGTVNTSGKQWSVYSAITQQHFDPLKFSHAVGDYNGSPSGGKWMTAAAVAGGASDGEM